MDTTVIKARIRRKKRVRFHIVGKSMLPRLSVFRSNKFIYAQVINDTEGRTIASKNDVKMKMTASKKMSRIERAKKIGLELGVFLIEKKIIQVVFDRGSYAYKGRVKATAEGVREAGIKI